MSGNFGDGHHPAQFSKGMMEIAAGWLEPGSRILDPFAGVGGVFQLREFLDDLEIMAWEIEPIFATQHPETIVGDFIALSEDGSLPDRVGTFDAIVTSPSYGNRMADRALDDGTKRYSYAQAVGGDLEDGNLAALHWGPDYRQLHSFAWFEATEALRPGGVFILAISDHIRAQRRQPVSHWHVGALMRLGMDLTDWVAIPTRRNRNGANADARVENEWLFCFTKRGEDDELDG